MARKQQAAPAVPETAVPEPDPIDAASPDDLQEHESQAQEPNSKRRRGGGDNTTTTKATATTSEF